MGRKSFQRKKRLVAVEESLEEPEEEPSSYTSAKLRLAIVESGHFVSWDGLGNQDLFTPNPSGWSVIVPSEASEVAMDYDAQEELDSLLLDDDNDDTSEEAGSKEGTDMKEGQNMFSIMSAEGKGEAQLIRLLLTIADLTFDDVIVAEEDMEEVLASIPIKRLPIIYTGNELSGDIPAVVRMLARMIFLLGETNNDHLIVEATYERLRALKVKHAKAVELITQSNVSKDKLEWVCHQLNYVILPPMLEEWNRQVLSSAGPFIVASGMTLADLAIMDFLDQCSSKINVEALMTDYPALSDLVMLVKRHAKISKFLTERAALE